MVPGPPNEPDLPRPAPPRSTVVSRRIAWWRTPQLSPPSFAELLGYVALAAIVVWWAWRAFHDPYARDTGLAWDAGQLGWATGHPERLSTWNGMTFLVTSMAVLGRVFTRHQTGELVTLVNLVIVAIGGAYLLHRLRDRLSRSWWWVTAFALFSFGPLMSTVWWKQFNLMALGLAAAGFALARKHRPWPAGLLIALSISIKPMVFLLPLVLLTRRDTRRVGLIAVAGVVGIDILSQAVLAVRAGDLATLDPTIGPRSLVHKTSAAGNLFLCNPLNFSPTSVFCRLNQGFHLWTVQRIAVLLLVGLLALAAVQSLRGRRLLDWETLAFACPFSIMLSALAWPHYQVMLLPLFVLMFVRLTTDGRPAEWVAFVASFALASIMWEPFGTVVSAVAGHENPQTTTFVEEYAQLAQYLLVLAAIAWYLRHPASAAPSQAVVTADAPGTSTPSSRRAPT